MNIDKSRRGWPLLFIAGKAWTLMRRRAIRPADKRAVQARSVRGLGYQQPEQGAIPYRDDELAETIVEFFTVICLQI
jgi:hypothetical protein